MTDAELKTAVFAAISAGLDAEYWASQQSKQDAAYNTAKNDIFARIAGLKVADVSADDTNVILAIAEQSLWLLRNYASTTDQVSAILSESVDGISRSYAASAETQNGTLSPRALAYLQQAIEEHRSLSIKNFRFVRG